MSFGGGTCIASEDAWRHPSGNWLGGPWPGHFGLGGWSFVPAHTHTDYISLLYELQLDVCLGRILFLFASVHILGGGGGGGGSLFFPSFSMDCCFDNKQKRHIFLKPSSKERQTMVMCSAITSITITIHKQTSTLLCFHLKHKSPCPATHHHISTPSLACSNILPHPTTSQIMSI